MDSVDLGNIDDYNATVDVFGTVLKLGKERPFMVGTRLSVLGYISNVRVICLELMLFILNLLQKVTL